MTTNFKHFKFGNPGLKKKPYQFEHPVTILKVYVEWLNLVEDALIEKLLSGVTPNFIWSHQRNKLEWKRLRKDQIGKFINLFFPPWILI